MKTIGCVQHDCPECKAREAKTVEPVGQVTADEWSSYVEAKSTEWKERYLQKFPECHAPPPSGERDISLRNLAAKLRTITANKQDDVFIHMAADMLDANAQQVAVPHQYQATDAFYEWWGRHPNLPQHQALAQFHSAPQPPQAERVQMTFAQWFDGLSTNDRYDFDNDGRGFKRDSTQMMRIAYEAGLAHHHIGVKP